MQMKNASAEEAKKKGVTDIFRHAAAEGSPSAVFVFAWEGDSRFRGAGKRFPRGDFPERDSGRSAAEHEKCRPGFVRGGVGDERRAVRSQVRLRAGARARVRYGVSPVVYTVYRWQEREYRAGCRSPRADRQCPVAWQRGHPGQVKRGRCRARRQWRGSGGGRGRACHRPSRGRSGRVPAGHSPRSRR